MLATVTGTAATVGTGLVAGLLWGFAQAVMPGLHRTDDRTFVGAFQAMDRAIVRPLFVVVFAGSLLLAVAALVLHWGQPAAPWLLAAVVAYLAVIVITRAVHLPLNAGIGRVDPGGAEVGAARARFEARWVRWHLVRTVAAVLAFVCLVVGVAAVDVGAGR